MLGVSGTPVAELTLGDGQLPAPPKVEVLDSKGKSVYKCTLEYG